MNILEVYIESNGFDYRLIRGGIAVYLWNLTRAFRSRGHKTSVLSALNGQGDYLEKAHGLSELDYKHDWECKISADPHIWGNRANQVIPLETRAYHLHKEGTDFYYLGNDFLNRYPDTYYPPYDGKGTDLGFFKPLIFQMEVVRFINSWFADEDMLIHAHEPFYQYLLPAAFAGDPSKKMVSTVQSNMPITKKVYVPETREALRQIGADPDKAVPASQLKDTLFNRCLQNYMPRTHLSYPYPQDYVNLFEMVLADSDLIDFLSEGHRDFYTGFYGTAFRAMFLQLDTCQQYRQHAHKLFVGGCGLGEKWLSEGGKRENQRAVLDQMGFDPALPTFFHSARYAPNHKGQVELVLAVRQFLEKGGRANFIIRCITEAGITDPRFAALAADFPGLVYLTSEMQTDDQLMAMARESDFALFPSKFEMDTFLIAQGEAMAYGCIPVASDQLGMEHWQHGRGARDGSERTGFAVIRSFLEEDPALISSIATAIDDAVALFADPPRYAEMSERARNCALRFGWQSVADQHLAAFAKIDTNAEAPLVQDNQASPKDWQGVALESGQIVDFRHRLNGEVPQLALHSGDLIYLCPATSVTAFSWNGSGFEERQLSAAPEGNGFHGSGFINHDVFLLVTLENGDQFWDGLVPLDATVT
jgi:glycosyltransferase AcbS